MKDLESMEDEHTSVLIQLRASRKARGYINSM
jgi:hypothetical protein